MIQGMNPRTGQPVGEAVSPTSPDDVNRIARAAGAAAPACAAMPLAHRADMLRRVAASVEAHRAELVALADAETGLGEVRLDGELTRTTVQLEMFAGVVEEGSFLEVVIDRADPAAAPAPRPDLRRMLAPIGPVAAFAAGNFPFAFSVAGGDTASALAAGCPVVVKAHPGHPGLSVRCGQLLGEALAEAPKGMFGMVHGLAAGRDLVTHPSIAAVGFTGSLAAGRALFDLAASRPDPIPFYGELGSLNPSVVTPLAVAARGAQIAEGFVASMTLGSGQFCTKPGLLFLPTGHGLADTLAGHVGAATLGPLLNKPIRDGFEHGVGLLRAVPGARSVLPTQPPSSDLTSTMEESGYRVTPALYSVAASDVVEHAETLLTECFGPAALIVEYASIDELRRALDVLPGSLTATVHAEATGEEQLVAELLARLSVKAGRVIWDGWPTGVAVTWAQHHGGPWPATTAPLHTSVGATAVRRFQRPITFQNVPDRFLPPAVRDANPLGLPRRLNGAVEFAS